MKKKYKRKCPKCGSHIYHTTKSNCNNLERKKSVCRKCSNLLLSKKYRGSGNPFFNKKHSEEFKETLSIERKGKHFSIETQFKKGHKPTNRPTFEIWKEKYNEETYNKKVGDFKKKQSILNSGKNNNMYGKPSPQGSGNGWSGWYKNWYFRSLSELSYMVSVIERFNLKWESGELNKYKIKYVDPLGNERNYFSDFIINDKFVVECKPKRLWNTPSNLCKKKGALTYCNENKLTYHVTQPRKLTYNEIKNLYDKGYIEFLKKYDEKFKKYILTQ